MFLVGWGGSKKPANKPNAHQKDNNEAKWRLTFDGLTFCMCVFRDGFGRPPRLNAPVDST